MINKLTRFAAFAVITTLTTIGCVRQEVVSAPLVTPSPPIVVRAPKTPPARQWSVDSVVGWKLIEESVLEGDDTQVVGHYENTVSEETTAIGQILAMSLTEESAATFYVDMEEAATTRDPAKVKVLGTHKTKYGTLDGLEVLELRRVDGGVAIILSTAVSDGKVGYLVICGGNAEEAEAVLNVCKPFVKSFRVGK